PSIFNCQRNLKSKKLIHSYIDRTKSANESMSQFLSLVGLGRFELPTSPLSGVRSNQLSYRPVEADWWSWSGSNRRPPECKSGALPAELQPLFFWKQAAGRRKDYSYLPPTAHSPKIIE